MSEVVVICVDSMTPGCLFKDESVMKDLKALGCKKHSDAEVCSLYPRLGAGRGTEETSLRRPAEAGVSDCFEHALLWVGDVSSPPALHNGLQGRL